MQIVLLAAGVLSLFPLRQLGTGILLTLETRFLACSRSGLHTVTIQSLGLGYSKPAAGLMERRPRSPSQPILSRGLIIWLVSVGLVIATGNETQDPPGPPVF